MCFLVRLYYDESAASVFFDTEIKYGRNDRKVDRESERREGRMKKEREEGGG